MNDSVKLSKGKYLLLGILSIVWIYLSLDGRLYWHEIRFMYASTHFSMDEIFSGVYNPHQVGKAIDEIGSGGFYLAKVLHLFGLKKLFEWIPPDKGGMYLSVFISVLIMGISGITTYRVFSIILGKNYAFLSLCCFLMTPVTAYLSGKILSEVPAFFFVTLSILFFSKGRTGDKSSNIIYTVASGLLLLCACLCRLDIVICFMGFILSLLIVSENNKRNIILIRAGIALIIFIAGEIITIYSLEKGLEYLTRYFFDFIHAGEKTSAMSIFGIVTFGGVIYLLAISALFSKEKKKVWMLAIWFSVSMGMEIIITWNYMVEPRYLVSGLLPLEGLAGLGLGYLMEKISGSKIVAVWVAAFITLVTVINAINIQLMPYELDRNSMLTTVKTIYKQSNNSIILIPWTYTDYHFLNVMFPGRNIFNVHSVEIEEKDPVLHDLWENRLKKWYGNKYLQSKADLNSYLIKYPVYYLGWHKYPPAEYARKIFNIIGFKKLSQYISDLPLKNHIEESWVWNSPEYRMELKGNCGQYEYYRVYPVGEKK